MDAIFNSKFMREIQKGGQKLGQNKFVAALQASMMSLMGALMVGAIFQIIQSVIGPTMLKLVTADSQIYQWLNIPYQFTMNALALWIVAIFAYQYAKSLKILNPLLTAVDALISFLIVAGAIMTDKAGTVFLNMTYLGAQGMFIGFLVVFIVVQIEHFCLTKNIRIKMPEVVPPFLQDGFSGILPLLFSTILFLGGNAIVSVASAGQLSLASGFMKILEYPLNALISTPGMFILALIALILWCFGIHGTMLMVSVIMPVSLQAVATNAALHAAGKPLVFNAAFLFGSLAILGGTGNTFPLVLLSLRAKSEQMKAVAKVSLIPGWFNINEPVTFGMPIMYNPMLAIPYVINPLVLMALWIVGYKLGFLQLPWIPVMTVMPIGIGDYLGTLAWQNFIWDYIMIIPCIAIWYPFFKIYDKQLYDKEQAEAKAQEN